MTIKKPNKWLLPDWFMLKVYIPLLGIAAVWAYIDQLLRGHH